MSILIKGMEMPKSCYACMFFAQTDYWNKEDEADILSHCKRTGEKTWESVNGSDFWNPDAEDNCFAAIHVVNCAPTIIEEER